MNADYRKLLDEASAKLEKLVALREHTDAEIVKLRQFISATAEMLPDAHRGEVMRDMESMLEVINLRDSGLTDAIRGILKRTAGECWLSAAQVRDELVSSGFDFSNYTANPLASVSTTLRRSKPDEVETATIEGVTAYRWKLGPAPPRRLSQAKTHARLTVVFYSSERFGWEDLCEDWGGFCKEWKSLHKSWGERSTEPRPVKRDVRLLDSPKN